MRDQCKIANATQVGPIYYGVLRVLMAVAVGFHCEVTNCRSAASVRCGLAEASGRDDFWRAWSV